MDEYIKRDALIAEYDRVHIGPPGGARKLMVEAPTADVVPRAEYDNLKIELEAMRGAANSYKMHYERLAKEIFKDIQSCVVDRNWDEWRENILSFVVDAEKYAELKKEYTKGDERE